MEKEEIIIVENKYLDENQMKAIKNEHRNNLVIASAGSGKTTTIIGKVKYLIQHKNIQPAEILCLSFTNKSTNELRMRIKKELDIELDVYTFHKLGINIIKQIDHQKEYLTKQEMIICRLLEKRLQEKEYLECFLNFYYKKVKKQYRLSLFQEEYANIIYYAQNLSEMINEIKQRNYNEKQFQKINENKGMKLYIDVIYPIYIDYEEYLKINNLIDFNDMINHSKTLIKNKDVVLPYKYIIVDEYQDISKSRYSLIKEIYDNNQASLFCVGDDYQCIYSYAGSNLDYFIQFSRYFGKFELTVINKTYRFNQRLANISGKFITKNKKQVQKEIDSHNKDDKDSLTIIDQEEIQKELENLHSYNKIYFLGRYKHDVKILEKMDCFYIDERKKVQLFFKRRIDLDIELLTVHQSKGLERDYVFVLNNTKGKFGFPSLVENDKIRNKLFPLENNLDEERRLFYVAITRAKKKTILVCKKNDESIFLKEIKKIIRKENNRK